MTKDDETRREVYLPRGVWYDFWTERRAPGQQSLSVEAPLERIPIFVRGGAIVPSQQLTQFAGEAAIDPLIFDIYPEGTSTAQYYEDDGISFDYQRGISLRQSLSVVPDAQGMTIELSARQGRYTPPARSLLIKVHNQRSKPRQVAIDEKELAARASLNELDAATEGWMYDEDANILWLKTPDRGTGMRAQIRD